MVRSLLLLSLALLVNISFSQEIIYEDDYQNLPFPVRIDNSGIYSIASFDVADGALFLSSFNNNSIYKYTGEKYYRLAESPDLQKDFIAGGSTGVLRLNKGAKESNSGEFAAYKKNFSTGSSILLDNGGDLTGFDGEEIKIYVANKNELQIESSLSLNKIEINFPSNLACADLIGIDKAGNYYVLVEKYRSEIPLQIERNVYTISKDGNVLSVLVLPDIKYLYTIKDLQIDGDGNLYHLMTLKEKFRVIKWKNLSGKNVNRIHYPEEYNYRLHFSQFTPTEEITGQPIILNKTNLTKAGRTKALQIAETYVLHQYECRPNNLAVNEITAPDGDAVRTPGWLVTGANARVPYKWGGFNTIAQFDAGLASGKYAGDIITSGVSSYALGVDCSGYVSRCWQLSYHSSTSDMPNITTQYSSWENLKPGDAIHKFGHVRLFIKRNSNGTFKVAEAAGRNWDVSYWSFSASDLTGYTPRYYNDMEDNYNSEQPTLTSVEKISVSSVRLKFSCNTANILGYRVYRSSDGINWNLVLDENSCKSTIADVIVTGTINFFRVSSVKNDSPNYSESIWSNILGVGSFGSAKKALIVDGFEREMETGNWQGAGHPFVMKYGKALSALNIDFASAKNSELINGSFRLQDYNYIFWILGDESTINETFNSAEQQLVINYLNNGGSLFVSGSEIGWDLDYKGNVQDKNFYNNYLKSGYVADDAQSSSVKGVAGGSLSDCSMNIGQTYEEDYPDEIAARNGSRICILYSNGKGAGVEYTGPFGNSALIGHLICLAFPAESTADDNSFNGVISKAVDYFNSVKVSVRETEELVAGYSLGQNYPNPFNPATKIIFSLPDNALTRLAVFDPLGNEIAVLFDREMSAGYNEVKFDGNNLPSGIYFYRIQSGNYSQTRKMILLK